MSRIVSLLKHLYNHHYVGLCALTLGAGLITGAGCGHTAREAGLGTLRTARAAMADTGRILVNGAQAFGDVGQTGDLPPTGQGSMASDNQPITRDQVDEIAARYGYSIEW